MKPQELAEQLKKLPDGESLLLQYQQLLTDSEIGRVGTLMAVMTGARISAERVDERTVKLTKYNSW